MLAPFPKAPEDWRTPKPCGIARILLWRDSVLECASPLALFSTIILNRGDSRQSSLMQPRWRRRIRNLILLFVGSRAGIEANTYYGTSQTRYCGRIRGPRANEVGVGTYGESVVCRMD